MKILGIDYGRSKVGLAVSYSSLSEPLKVLRYKNLEVLITEIKKVLVKEEIEKVVVGVSEAEMGIESKGFSQTLKNTINLPVETFDETLSTKEAQEKSIQSGIGPKKRREMEDAYAAAILLQNYLDSANF